MEERINELLTELAKVNKSFPSLERLEGWAPKCVDEKRNEAVAEKKINTMRVLKGFEPIGVWKDVYDLLVLREKIMREIDRIAKKLDGPAVFTSKELATDNDEL